MNLFLCLRIVACNREMQPVFLFCRLFVVGGGGGGWGGDFGFGLYRWVRRSRYFKPRADAYLTLTHEHTQMTQNKNNVWIK